MMYVVTGGAGFIGSALTKALLFLGNEVVVVDDFSLGTKENIASGVSSVYSSINKIARNADGVFHLGMPSSSPMYKENHRLVSRVISDGIDVLEYCRIYNVPLVLASTSSVYNGLEPPFYEDDIIDVTDYYTEARYALERMVEMYSKEGLSAMVLRLFSVYGPNETHKGRYANLVSQFIWSMLKNEYPIIYGDGKQSRDFIYVDDVVNSFISAMFLVKQRNFTVVNVGRGMDTNLLQLVNMLNVEMETNIKPKLVNNPIKNYVQCTRADTNKMNRMLGPAQVPLREGIRRTIEFYRKGLK